ncbi:MAG TPA: acetylxylan esterase [Terriglobia bacterium]|nr:acetylxylan esterase [Terriglobia bacterium]
MPRAIDNSATVNLNKNPVVSLVLVLFLCVPSLSAQDKPRDALVEWMNRIAQQQLQQRAELIRGIRTKAQAESRKRWVRKQMLDDMGGLPDYRGPLNARFTGQLRNNSYTVEKVIYQSLPGLYVTANVYRPNQPGRYPAVLLQAGHTQEGKPEDQRMAANLAMKGFVALCFDPIGQGEREQTYSPQLDAPLAGWSVPEHIQMGAQAQLIGEGLARYFIFDAMRSLDYLSSRPDVDASRLGAAGCSGGGALTTFLGGLDPRVKVVIPACYPSSFQTLFATSGPDVEMVLPRFLASGLDTADFVELPAPTPWLLQSTEHDEYHFSHQGVRLVYDEARNWYALYGGQDKVGFTVGQGPHGMPLEAREAVYQWMIRYLKNGQGDFHEQPVEMYTNHQLQVTASGNVENEPGSRKLYQVLRAEFKARKRAGTAAELLAKLRELKIPTDRSAPKIQILDQSSDAAGQKERIKFESVPGIWLRATLRIPSSPGKKPAVLVLSGGNMFGLMPTATIAEHMAKAGRVVLEMEPRRSQMEIHEGPFAGDYVADVQANLIGLDLPAMRAHDILRGVDLLAARSDVGPGSIRAAARGVSGIWLLLAAAADPRIGKIWIDRTPSSLRSALDNTMAADLWDAVIPGFILHWDLNDLVTAMGKRQVMWTDPTNWLRRVVPLGAGYEYRYVLGDTTDLAQAQDDAYIRELLQ